MTGTVPNAVLRGAGPGEGGRRRQEEGQCERAGWGGQADESVTLPATTALPPRGRQ